MGNINYKNLGELEKLYYNLKTVKENVTEENEFNKIELNTLTQKREELIDIKNQVKAINDSNSIVVNKNCAIAFGVIGAIALGNCIYVGSSFTDTAPEIINLVLSALTLYGSSMATYVSLDGYKYDKKMVKDNNILYLNPKIIEIEKQIERKKKEIETNNKILQKCNTNLPIVERKLIELSPEPSKYNSTNNVEKQKPKKRLLIRQKTSNK